MKRYASIAILLLLLSACKSAPKPKPPIRGDLEGVVYDLDKAPVGGALIELARGDSRLSATTDAQGRFSFQAIEEGEYSLSFSKGMYETRSWPLEVRDFAEAVYLQTAGYWQLLDAALDALGRKEWAEAGGYLERAGTILEKSTTSLFLQAVLDEKGGKAQAAIEGIKAALGMDARSPHLWLYLADLYERSGADKALIMEALTRYLELRDDPLAAERLSLLRQ
jgi:hypothetical protein